jgi:hypothetical protein
MEAMTQGVAADSRHCGITTSELSTITFRYHMPITIISEFMHCNGVLRISDFNQGLFFSSCDGVIRRARANLSIAQKVYSRRRFTRLSYLSSTFCNQPDQGFGRLGQLRLSSIRASSDQGYRHRSKSQTLLWKFGAMRLAEEYGWLMDIGFI